VRPRPARRLRVDWTDEMRVMTVVPAWGSPQCRVLASSTVDRGPVRPEPHLRRAVRSARTRIDVTMPSCTPSDVRGAIAGESSTYEQGSNGAEARTAAHGGEVFFFLPPRPPRRAPVG